MLWAEMTGDPDGQSKPLYDGTVASLIDCYQRDSESGWKAWSPGMVPSSL